MFWKNIMLQSSKKLNTDGVIFSEVFVAFNQTTRHHIAGYSALHIYRCGLPCLILGLFT